MHRPVVVLQTPNLHSGLHSVIMKEHLIQQYYQQRIGRLVHESDMKKRDCWQNKLPLNDI